MVNKDSYNKIGWAEGQGLPGLDFTKSEGSKRKNSYGWAKDMIDYYDSVCLHSQTDMAYYDENYELHRGSWSSIENHEDNIDINFEGQKFGLSGLKIRHFPLINVVGANILGGIISNPLIPIVRDFSASSKNYRDRQKQNASREYLSQRFVKPKLNQIRQQYYASKGVEDPNALNPQQLQQSEQEIQQLLQRQLPDELIEAMESQLSPEERIFQKLLNFVIKDEGLQEKFNQGAEHSVVVAEEYYRINIINSKPHVEVLNPKLVTYYGSEHTEWVEDMTAAKYEQYLTPQDVIQKYGEELMKKDIEELQNLFSYEGTAATKNNKDWSNVTFTEALADNPELKQYIGEPQTREGQQKLAYLYSVLTRKGHKNTNNRTQFGVRESYICYKFPRWMKYVTRKEGDKLVNLWKADHYTKREDLGDVKVERRQVPQVWHGVILGEPGSNIKIMVEPVPWQYNSLKDPFRVKLPIHGRKINTSQNNADNSSFYDLGKQYQFEYNSLRRDWEKYRRTNIGKVLMGFVNMIPDKMNIAEFHSILSNLNIAFLNNKYEGINQLDAQMIREIDLSNTTDMRQVVEDMARVKHEMYEVMFSNPANLGRQSPYETATGIQQSIQATNTQLAKFHDIRRQIKERVLEYTLNVTIAAYADNEDKKAQILDDQSLAYLAANYKFLSTREFSLFVVDDFRETRRVEFIKQQVQALIQNGATVSEIIAIMKSDSISEMEKIAEKIDRRRQKETQEQRQHEIKVIDKQRENQIDLERLQFEKEKALKERDNEVKLAMAELNSMQLANANDIDKNKIPDSLQKAMVEIASEERQQDKELAFKRWQTNKEAAKST